MSNEDNFLASLPVPPKEKAMRYLYYAGASALALAGVLIVMPVVNQGLGLLLTGTSLLLRLGAVSAAIAAGGLAVYTFWPVYQRLLESLARRSTAFIFGEDPITPLEMWLGTVRDDREDIEKSTADIDGLIAENESTISENTRKAEDADRRFKTAVREYGERSEEAQIASVQAGGYLEGIRNLEQVNQPLKMMYAIFSEIAKVTRVKEIEAERAVENATTQWRAALKAQKALGAAQRILGGRSQEYLNAKQSFAIIHQKYAGTFGQLRALRQLSKEAITQVTLNNGVYHEEAMERLRSESQKLLGYSPAIPMPLIKTAEPQLAAGKPETLRLFDDTKD